jgi:PAS domain S-box-containing protein
MKEIEAGKMRGEESPGENEEPFRKLLQTIPSVAVQGYALDGTTQYWNQASEQLYGYSAQEAIGVKLWDLIIPPEIRGDVMQAMRQMAETGQQIPASELSLKRKDGSRVSVFSSHAIIKLPGRAAELYCIDIDLTERKRAEDALRTSEENYRCIFENLQDVYYEVTIAGLILNISPSIEKISKGQYRREEIVGRSLFDFYENPKERDLLLQVLQNQGSAIDYEIMLKNRDGSAIPCSVSAKIICDAHGRPTKIIGSMRDITERKRAEAELQRLGKWLLRTQQISKVGGWTINLKTEAVWVSPEARRIYGVREDYPLSIKQIQAFPLCQFRPMLDLALRELIAHNKVYDVKFQICRGTDHAIVDIHSLAEYNANDGIVIGVIEDITERKILEEQFHQAQKMESIGQLAGGVAHDFNNILAAIMMHLSCLRQNPNLDLETKASLQDLMVDAKRAAGVTRQLLLFSRRSVLDISVVDMNELVPNLLKMLGRLIGEHVTVQFHRCEGLPAVEADANMIEQVVMNLALNARDAMPKGGLLTIRLDPIDIRVGQVQGKTKVSPGLFVCLSVADTGCGMDEATLKHVFEPFFTTKDVGKGTGLGLATVHGIVAQHKGWVDAQSELGKGATFKVFLPAATTVQFAPAPSEKPAVIRGHETILLVEDEANLRRLVAQGLRLLGYRVMEADNGQTAMKLWQEHVQQIDLLFSDMMMPEGLTGLDLVEKLRQEKSNLKAIISSGYNVEMALHGKPATGNIVFFQKPYEFEALSKTIRDCLDRG